MTAEAPDLLAALQEHEADWTIAWLIEHADSELWAPRQFIIVDELTRGSPSLAAAWRAIYRLWVFYRPLGRRRFGLRMIADVGGVGRGHLSGKHGAIRKLRELGLISVTGMGDNPRDDDARSDRWEYDIDPARLEARSIRLIRSRIAAGQLVARRRPEAQRRDLCAALDLAPAEATLDLSGAAADAMPFIEIPSVAPVGASAHLPAAPPSAAPNACAITVGEVAPSGATSESAWHHRVPGTHPNGATSDAAPAPSGATTPELPAPLGAIPGLMWHPSVPDHPVLAPLGATSLPPTAPTGAEWPQPVPPHQPDLAPSGAHGWRDGEIEREGEGVPATHAHDSPLSLQAIEQLIERALARQLGQLTGGRIDQVCAPTTEPTPVQCDDLATRTPPSAPEGEPPLPLPLLAIWETVSKQRPAPEPDRAQITMLIGRYQVPAQGHSAYWLGRVMLFADLCRSDAEPIKLKLINAYMRRMVDTGFSTTTLEDRTLKGEKHAAKPVRSEHGQTPTLPSEPAPADHPAIAAYVAAFGRAPNAVQSAQIAEAVTDTAAWQRVLTVWQANAWQAGAVAKMIDRYHKETGTPAADEPPPSAFIIHERVDLSDDQRDPWLRRFHAAPTIAEKRTIIARFEQEYPR